MADNWATRFIDYSNRQGFEGLLDFFFHPKITWDIYQQRYFPEKANITTFNKAVDDPYDEWAIYWTGAHYLASLLFRLALLPVTSIVYVLSRTFLIVLNPFTAWGNNGWKALSMSMVWAIPTFLALNNHVHAIMPDLIFSSPLSLAHFHRVSAAFGMPHGHGMIGASFMGGLILTGFMAVVMALALHAAKKFAQSRNAVEIEDPAQTAANFAKCAHRTISTQSTLSKSDNMQDTIEVDDPKIKTQWASHPNKADITAPKHRVRELSGNEETPLDNPYNDYNDASNKLRYAYYALKRPAICGEAPWQVKQVLNAFDGVNKTHRTAALPVRFTQLEVALSRAFTTGRENTDNVSKLTRETYQLDSTVSSYKVDLDSNTLQRKKVNK